jgi:hypothetical protein
MILVKIEKAKATLLRKGKFAATKMVSNHGAGVQAQQEICTEERK